MSSIVDTSAVEPLAPPEAQPHDISPETPTETPSQPDESCAQVAASFAQPTAICTPIEPATQTALAEDFDTTRTSISNWLKKIRGVLDRCPGSKPVFVDGGLVSAFAQAELVDYRQMGHEEYERNRLARYGATPPSAPPRGAIVRSVGSVITDPGWDALDDVQDVEFEDIAPEDASELLFVDSLDAETQELGIVIDKTRKQTDGLLQRRRRIRRNNIAGMARRDAAEDIATYDRAYRDEMAKRGA